MAPAQQGYGRWRRAVDGDPFAIRGSCPRQAACLFNEVRRGGRQDKRGHASKGRQHQLGAHIALDLKKAVAVPGGEGDHGRVFRAIGLDQGAAGPFGAPGAACDLAEELIGPLPGAKVSAFHAAVGIDHANQGEVREIVALGDDLRADQHIDFACSHAVDNAACLFAGPGGVGGENFHPRLRQQHADFFGHALHAGADAHQRILCAAHRAGFGLWHRPAGQVADETVGIAVLCQPAFGARAFQPLAARLAYDERGIAAPVEEKQALLTGLEGRDKRVGEGRREPVAFLGRVETQINEFDVRQSGRPRTGREFEALITALFSVHHCLQRGRGGGEDDGRVFELCPHHAHVAGMIGDAVFLFETRIVLLIHDDEFEVAERQEQRRARADHDAGAAMRRLAPGAPAFGVAEARMPGGGRGAKAGLEAGEHGLGQCDFRQQDEDLRVTGFLQGFGDGLEIDFRLAGACDAIEQEGLEAAPGDGAAKLIACGFLLTGEVVAALKPGRLGVGKVGLDLAGLQ